MASNRILFFGTLGIFSHSVLNLLIRENANIVGVVLPGSETKQKPIRKLINIPILAQSDHDTVELLALKHSIPIEYFSDLNTEEAEVIISDFEPDFIVIACYPQMLPAQIFSMPRVACLNIHPSMLPSYRGPTPIFWQLRNDESRTGVSIHIVSEKLDAGDIIQRQEHAIQNGMSGSDIDIMFGELGARLIIKCINLYARDLVNPKPQNPAFASYYKLPGANDFRISTDWTARRAYNFMRGTEQWKENYTVNIDDRDIRLVNATAFSPRGTIDNSYSMDGDIVTIQFSEGLLKATPAPYQRL